MTNPPYGARVGGPDVRDLYDRFGAVLRERAGGWHVALLASRDTPVARLHLPLVPILETANGGIPVAVHDRHRAGVALPLRVLGALPEAASLWLVAAVWWCAISTSADGCRRPDRKCT